MLKTRSPATRQVIGRADTWKSDLLNRICAHDKDAFSGVVSSGVSVPGTIQFHDCGKSP